MGFFDRIRKGDKVKVLEIIDDGREFALTDMTRANEVILDKLKGKEYAIVTDSIDFNITGNVKKGRYHLYLIDPMCGATVQIGRDESILKTRTNANLIGTVMSSRLLQQAFAIKPDISQLLIIGIVALIIGVLIGKAI